LFRFDRRSIQRERSSATDGCCAGTINRTHWSLSVSLCLSLSLWLSCKMFWSPCPAKLSYK
jgi:hypothetical protein